MAQVTDPSAKREEIVKLLRSLLPELRERFGVRTLAIFGSYARGEHTPRSDLDLLVEFDERPLTLLQVIKLEHELSDQLGIRVDLVERSALKPDIGRRIVQEALPV